MKTREMISKTRIKAISSFIGKIISHGTGPYLVAFGLFKNNQMMLMLGAALLITDFIDVALIAWTKFQKELKMLEIEEAMLDYVDNLEKENRA